MSTQSAQCATTVVKALTDIVGAAWRRSGIVLAAASVALILPAGNCRAESSKTSTKSNTCVACHRTAETAKEFAPWAQDQFLHWYGAVHGQKAVTCEKCHGGDPKHPDKNGAHRDIVPSRDTKSPVYFKNLPETCGKCHKAVSDQFATSKHYRELKDDRLAPSCTTCHGFEMDVGSVNPLQLAGRCSLCHNTDDPGVKPEVAEAARKALEHVLDTERELEQAVIAVGLLGDGSSCAARIMLRIDEGKRQLRLSSRHWHAFDLDAFEKELTAVRSIAEQARKEALAKIGAEKP